MLSRTRRMMVLQNRNGARPDPELLLQLSMGTPAAFWTLRQSLSRNASATTTPARYSTLQPSFMARSTARRDLAAAQGHGIKVKERRDPGLSRTVSRRKAEPEQQGLARGPKACEMSWGTPLRSYWWWRLGWGGPAQRGGMGWRCSGGTRLSVSRGAA
jgi:hypothetical protein